MLLEDGDKLNLLLGSTEDQASVSSLGFGVPVLRVSPRFAAALARKLKIQATTGANHGSGRGTRLSDVVLRMVR